MSLNLRPLHILVVEDIAPMRELTVSVLKALGIGRITVASGGDDGFEEFCWATPDIVLADWHMPNGDGLSLAHSIRTSPKSPNRQVPIILMTGYGAPAKIKSARDVGVTEFLSKPFSSKDLTSKILHVIKHPRDFIISQSFTGPCRRRRSDDGYSSTSRRDPNRGGSKRLKASTALQTKTGIGLVDEAAVLRSQKIIDENKINFKEFVLMFLGQFADAIQTAQNEATTNRRSIERIIDPVMQIKANAQIFKFKLIGDLASIMLDFVEGLNEIDKDAMDIITAHHRTLSHLVQHVGDSSQDGESLKAELIAACKRYMNSRILLQKQRLQKTMADSAQQS